MRTVQKTPCVWAIFTPKSKIKQGQGSKAKNKQKATLGEIRENAEDGANRDLSIFAGSKIKQVKESVP